MDNMELREPSRLRDDSPSKILTFDQILDHFNNTDTRTFKQKYIINTEFCAEKDCPIFLHIGGEGPLPDTTLEGGKYSNYYFGKELGAALVALEHRYYGQSYPNAD